MRVSASGATGARLAVLTECSSVGCTPVRCVIYLLLKHASIPRGQTGTATAGEFHTGGLSCSSGHIAFSASISCAASDSSASAIALSACTLFSRTKLLLFKRPFPEEDTFTGRSQTSDSVPNHHEGYRLKLDEDGKGAAPVCLIVANWLQRERREQRGNLKGVPVTVRTN